MREPSLVLESENVVFNSRRMKRVPDKAIERELDKWSNEIKGVKRLIL